MNKVYVLGAGASAGYTGSYIGETSPVARNFFQKAALVKNIHHIRDRDFNDEAMQYRHIFQFIKRFWGVAPEHLPQANLNMEEVLTLLHIELEESRAEHDFLLRAYEEYLILMALTFEKILYGAPCPYHRAIAESLQPGDTVISFNYELLMDYALAEPGQGKKVNWQFTDGYGVSCCKIDGAGRLLEQANRGRSDLQLLKLHGSLNWLYCPVCHRLYTYKHTGPRGQSVVVAGVANKFQCAAPHCGHRLFRVIIPPTLMKDYDTVPFIQSLWRKALAALIRARQIIIIGYSFPPTDFRSVWLFRKAMMDNRHLERVLVVDKAVGVPGKDFLNKYSSIFPVPQIKTFSTISQFTASLADSGA